MTFNEIALLINLLGPTIGVLDEVGEFLNGLLQKYTGSRITAQEQAELMARIEAYRARAIAGPAAYPAHWQQQPTLPMETAVR